MPKGGRPRDRLPDRVPVLTSDSWTDPVATLETLRSWAIESAEKSVMWYLNDKRSKRKASRLLRGLSIILAAAGGVVPQLGSLGLPLPADGFRIGYAAFALAAACVAFDYFFGLSSGWMRDIAAAQSLQSMIRQFDLKWLQESSNFVEPLDNGVVADRLNMIYELLTGVEDVVAGETAEWTREFATNIKKVGFSFGNGADGFLGTHDGHSLFGGKYVLCHPIG